MLKLLIITLQIESGKMFWQSFSLLSNTAVGTDPIHKLRGQFDQRGDTLVEMTHCTLMLLFLKLSFSFKSK